MTVATSLRALGSTDAPVNVGTIGGGRSVNTIADSATMLVEQRALAQEPLQGFEHAVRGLALAEPLRVETEIVGRRPAGRLDRDAPLLRRVVAVRDQLGLETTLSEGSTDANAALAAGIPALCVGVARGSGMHTLNERIDRRSLERGATFVEALLRDLLTTESQS
jgi:acetylornithine deacetylase/succinyl-diaminopimelate desuccinylase-like protein